MTIAVMSNVAADLPPCFFEAQLLCVVPSAAGVINMCYLRLSSPLRQRGEIHGQARVNFTSTGEGSHVRLFFTFHLRLTIYV